MKKAIEHKTGAAVAAGFAFGLAVAAYVGAASAPGGAMPARLRDAPQAAAGTPQTAGQAERGAQLPAAPAGRGRMVFTEPSPMDFDDHDGYVSLFDGVSLTGWDGNPKFWRVEDGAIVGESTPPNPSGNSYIVYRDWRRRTSR